VSVVYDITTMGSKSISHNTNTRIRLPVGVLVSDINAVCAGVTPIRESAVEQRAQRLQQRVLPPYHTTTVEMDTYFKHKQNHNVRCVFVFGRGERERSQMGSMVVVHMC
jgi:hypothetical protein